MSNGDPEPLSRATVPTGQERTLTVLQLGTLARFHEKYTGAGTGWLGSFANFWVEARLEDLEPLVGPAPSAEGLRTFIRERIGELEDLPLLGARETVAGWFAGAGVTHRRGSSTPHIRLGASTSLSLHLGEPPWQAEFNQHTGGGQRRTRVTLPYEAVGPVDRFAREVREFDADRLAAWCVEAGIPHEVRTEHRHELLRTHRGNTDCAFWLTLGISSIDDKIWFSENYEYYSRPGDSGREYAYTARTPYGSLARLVEFFEDQPGTGDPEDRLVACFTELVSRGELRDDGLIEGNRNRVGAWFTEAGVPYVPDFWFWMNSSS